METEFLQLAREAVAAMQLQAAAAGSTSWVEITQAVASVVGLGCIVWGLFSMKAAGARRDREIDVLAENMRENTRVVGQALERQGAAMTKALTQQGEVLAELLRRSNPA
jgi:hypothetical protein